MARAKPKCACGCGRKAVHRHHGVYEQTVIREGGDPEDGRNLVPMAFDCHLAHHGRSRVLPLERLPDSVFEFALELLGPASFDYLRRRYAGEDARLEALLSV